MSEQKPSEVTPPVQDSSKGQTTSAAADVPAGTRDGKKEGFGAALLRNWSGGSFWSDAAVMIFAVILALIIGALLMVFSSPEILEKYAYFFSQPGDALAASWDKIASAYSALVRGSFGSWYAITETTSHAAPLICAGLGVALGFRVGLFNIGGQGQAIWGAIVAAYLGFTLDLPIYLHLPIAILGGIAGGAIWAAIAGVLRTRFGAHEVITTIMLNYIASGLLIWGLNTALLQRPGRSDPIAPFVAESATLPSVSGTRLHLGFLLALIAVVVVWWLLDHTKLGFQIRAVGANPDAAATAGMSSAAILTLTMVISGGLCGLAGVQSALAPDVNGTPTPLAVGLVGSIGFDAITVALLGRSKPLGTLFAGLLFGALNAGGLAMQGQAQTPAELASVLQAVIVLFVAAPMLVRTLVPFLKARKKHQAPADLLGGGQVVTEVNA